MLIDFCNITFLCNYNMLNKIFLLTVIDTLSRLSLGNIRVTFDGNDVFIETRNI